MSKKIINSIELNLNDIRPNQRRSLSHEMFHSVFDKLWEGLSEEDFFKYFLEANAAVNKIFLFRHRGKLIGYLIFRVIELEIDGKKYGIVRLSANLLPEHQGQQLMTWPVFNSCLQYYLKTRLSRIQMLLFFTANAPFSYCAFYHRSRLVYPNPNRPTPQKYLQLLQRLAEHLGLKTYENNPFVCNFESASFKRDSAPAKRVLDDPAYKFYIEQCPGYAKGDALLVFLPIGLISGILDIMFRLKLSMKKKLSHGLATFKLGRTN